MATLHHILILLTTLGYIDGYRLIFGPPDYCQTKKAYAAAFKTTREECDRIIGHSLDSDDPYAWIDCIVDLCLLPSQGPILKSSDFAENMVLWGDYKTDPYLYVWGIDTDQKDTTRGSDRVYSSMITTRDKCDLMGGFYHDNPLLYDLIDCYLYLKRMKGDDSRNVDSLIFCGSEKDDCNVVAWTRFDIIHKECLATGGDPIYTSKDEGAYTWVVCFLDIAYSPAIQCIPTDMWIDVQICWNEHPTVNVTCQYERRTGIEKGISIESTTGSSTSFSVTAEVGAALSGLFSASASASFTTSHDWAHSSTNEQIWTEATTTQVSAIVPPNTKMAIRQVVGKCGDYYVRTTELVTQ